MLELLKKSAMEAVQNLIKPIIQILPVKQTVLVTELLCLEQLNW